MSKTINGQLEVWWIPQVPMTGFRVPVNSLVEAKLILKTLGDYDLFQFDNNIKPDYSNAGGLEVFRDGEWEEWYDDDMGEGIDDITDEQAYEFDMKRDDEK